jgi:hypothetical protein
MALSNGSYRSPSVIPNSEATLNATYSRHVWVKCPAVPAIGSTNQTAAALRSGFSSGFAHDECYWDHPSGTFYRSNAHRQGGYVAAQMSSGGFTAGAWHSMGCVWTGSLLQSYLNGVADGSTAGVPAGSNSGFEVCMRASSGWGTVEGQMSTGETAELAIWDVALTVDDFAALAKGFRATRIRPQNLVLYWPAVRGRRDLIAGRTATLHGTEAFSDHPRVFG